jgi:hypothetical protein
VGKLKTFQFGRVHGGLHGNLREVSCLVKKWCLKEVGCLKEKIY